MNETEKQRIRRIQAGMDGAICDAIIRMPDNLFDMPKKPTVKKVDCDGNSEKSLIALIRSLLRDMFSGVSKVLNSFKSELKTHNKETKERLDQVMTALETLTDSVNKNTAGQALLTTAVNAAIVKLGSPSPTDAQLLSLAAQVDSSTESDAALTAALNAAVTPEPPTEPTT